MKRTLSSLVAGAALALAVPALAETFTVTLVQTNDIDRMEADDDRGGFAKLAGLIKAERAKGGTVFLVHSGDTLSPSLLSGIDKGAHIIDLLNHLGVDMMVPGNHEFDFGPEVFQERINEATFPIVSSNVIMPGGGGPANTMTDTIVEVNGVNIGFYGLTTEDTVTISNPGDIEFTDSVETGVDAAADLREQGADIVIGVMHTPVDVDFELARSHTADIILTGHDEHLLTFFDGRTVMTESGAQAEWSVITDLTITTEQTDSGLQVSWEPSFRIVDTLTVEPDAEMAAVVQGYVDKLDQELGVAIGTTTTALDSRRSSVRSQETAIGNLITDAMRETVGADLAITNGGGIRADREYEPGTELTRKDILSELPFGNTTVKLELTGEQIRAALENGFSQVENGAGRFPQVSGLTVSVDLANPAGGRVLDVMAGGAPLDPGRVYTVATNDFMASGGDGYGMFVGAPNLIAPADAVLMASQVIDYIAAKSTVSPAVEGRITMQ